ncbi:MAG TPA: ATP-binding protein [Candidatus Wunengus sp. YC61]|uniref:ATP-binding protein n=1 Tax=Candidatus Wunengus sp. YC61 TaxID=3367698 RepID=UPI004025B9BB
MKQTVNTLPVVTGLTTKKEMAGFYKDYRGIVVAGASKPIPQLEWVLMTEIDENEILSFMRLMLMSAPIPAGIIIIVGVVLFIHFLKADYKCANGILLTEKKRMEEEQNALMEQLYHSQKLESVGTLAGGIAHDFNNILAIIIGYGNMLEKNLGNASLSRLYIQKILKSAERATNLVQGLLAFSRKQESSQNLVPINRIMLEVKTLLSRLIGENIVLDIVPAKKDCVVMADCGQMEQVLINLATNARDAMPSGGTLTITTEVIELDDVFIKVYGYGEIGKYVLISVKDTGMGMDKETQRRIFQPFFTTKEVGKGTGLGLSIAYGIIKQHGGYINVESEPGKGATFRIYLPLIKSTVEEGKPTPLPAYLNGTEMILLAEDEEEVRNITKSLLEEANYKVIEAVDGYDTINKFMENKDTINLLLLDVIMPTKNGREAYEEIRKIRPDIKALFMSGYSESVIHKIIILKEGLNYISKPFSQTALLKKVREILDNSTVSSKK